MDCGASKLHGGKNQEMHAIVQFKHFANHAYTYSSMWNVHIWNVDIRALVGTVTAVALLILQI